MAKYSFEFKLAIVQEYLEGKGGLGYLAKKHGVSSKNRYTDGSMLIGNLEKKGSCVSEKSKVILFNSR